MAIVKTFENVSLYKKSYGSETRFKWTIKIEFYPGSSIGKNLRRVGTELYIDIIRTGGTQTVFSPYLAVNYEASSTGCTRLIATILDGGAPVGDPQIAMTKGAVDEPK